MAKDDKSYHEAEASVVGLRYRMTEDEVKALDEAVEAAGSLLCVLELEPYNSADPHAVKVSTKAAFSKHIGYIARPANEPIYKLLKDGRKVTCLLYSVNPDRWEATAFLRIEKLSASLQKKGL